MRKTLYIFEKCRIKKDEKTIKLIIKDEPQFIPIEEIKDIVIFGEVEFNKRVLGFLSANNVMIHFFNFYENYIGTYYPKNRFNSGEIVVKQSLFYLKKAYRLYLAKEFAKSSIYHLIINLKYFQKNFNIDLTNEIKILNNIGYSVDSSRSVNEVMGKEGNSRDIYYRGLSKVINGPEFYFTKRVSWHPKDPVNSMISFGNALLYSTILSIIYQTFLDPRIGYLHSSNQRSFSLNLDLADIFKPLIVDRIIISMINLKQIQKQDFYNKDGLIRLRNRGKKTFLKKYEKKLSKVIKYNETQRKSYKEIIKAECYKLYRHFLEEDMYKGYRGRG